MLRFLHISDMHIGQARALHYKSTYELCQAQMLDDCRGWLERRDSKNVDGILITGDIAFSATPEDYEEAALLLAKLKEAVKCEKVCVVPGNHDVDWRDINLYEYKYQQKIRTDENGIDLFYSYLSDGSGKFDPLRKLANYNAFVDKNKFVGVVESSENAQWHKDFPLGNGRTLRINGFCSALLSNDQDAPGNLVLGVQQSFGMSLANINVDHLVMMHHPLQWYRDFAKSSERIMAECQIVLTGHEHSAGMQTLDNVIFIGAGALNPPKKESVPFCFNWIEITDVGGHKNLKVEYFPRLWKPDNQNGAFLSDTKNRRYNEQTQSVIEFVSSKNLGKDGTKELTRLEQILSFALLSEKEKLLLIRPELYKALRRLVPEDKVPDHASSQQLLQFLKTEKQFPAEILADLTDCAKRLAKLAKGEQLANLEVTWTLKTLTELVPQLGRGVALR